MGTNVKTEAQKDLERKALAFSDNPNMSRPTIKAMLRLLGESYPKMMPTEHLRVLLYDCIKRHMEISILHTMENATKNMASLRSRFGLRKALNFLKKTLPGLLRMEAGFALMTLPAFDVALRYLVDIANIFPKGISGAPPGNLAASAGHDFKAKSLADFVRSSLGVTGTVVDTVLSPQALAALFLLGLPLAIMGIRSFFRHARVFLHDDQGVATLAKVMKVMEEFYEMPRPMSREEYTALKDICASATSATSCPGGKCVWQDGGCSVADYMRKPERQKTKEDEKFLQRRKHCLSVDMKTCAEDPECSVWRHSARGDKYCFPLNVPAIYAERLRKQNLERL
jgi:hypothetical protein